MLGATRDEGCVFLQLLVPFLSFDALCGSESTEDITEYFRSELSQVKNFEVCSVDILLRMQKELATEKKTIISRKGIEHDFNMNMEMSMLMVRLLIQTIQLSPNNEAFIFGYNNQFIPTAKYDSKCSYKHADG